MREDTRDNIYIYIYMNTGLQECADAIAGDNNTNSSGSVLARISQLETVLSTYQGKILSPGIYICTMIRAIRVIRVIRVIRAA